MYKGGILFLLKMAFKYMSLSLSLYMSLATATSIYRENKSCMCLNYLIYKSRALNFTFRKFE